MSALSEQKGGDHYKKLGEYQPWKVLQKWLTPEELKGFMKGTVIKYLCREANKGERLDIEKAKHTLEIYLELTEKRRDKSHAEDALNYSLGSRSRLSRL